MSCFNVCPRLSLNCADQTKLDLDRLTDVNFDVSSSTKVMSAKELSSSEEAEGGGGVVGLNTRDEGEEQEVLCFQSRSQRPLQ